MEVHSTVHTGVSTQSKMAMCMQPTGECPERPDGKGQPGGAETSLQGGGRQSEKGTEGGQGGGGGGCGSRFGRRVVQRGAWQPARRARWWRGRAVGGGEKRIRGSGGSLEPSGPLPSTMHPHTVYMAYLERLPTPMDPG